MSLEIFLATKPSDIEEIKKLFVEYQQWLKADICFQGFEKELEDLPAHYDHLILARWDGDICGCVANKPYKTGSACEMKRLYVRDGFKNKGIGRALAIRSSHEAKKAGYSTYCLETLPHLDAAITLYKDLGFVEKAAENVIFLEKTL